MSKFYKIEELKVGMVVSLSEISQIRDTTLVLRKSSMVYEDGDPRGELVFIGEDYISVIDPGDAVLVTHYEDEDLWVD